MSILGNNTPPQSTPEVSKPLRHSVGGKSISNRRLNSVLKEYVKAGKTALQQHVLVEKMLIEERWIEEISKRIHSLENIAKKPKSFIKDERTLVAMERARNADRESLRHLSNHSNHISKIEKDGSVVPKKVLVKNMVEDFAIYENRVAYTLIRLLKIFIEQRYSAIQEFIRYYEDTTLKLTSEFEVGEARIEYDLSMKIAQRMDVKDTGEELLKKLEIVRKRVQILGSSNFAKVLSNTKLIKPPLNRTNILTKNVDYRNVYDLWLFISSFQEVGYRVHSQSKLLPFDEEYVDELRRVIAESLKVMIQNNTIRTSQFENVDFVAKKTRKLRIIKKITPELNKPTTPIFSTDSGINQYFLDKVKQIFSQQLKTAREENADKQEQAINSAFADFAQKLSDASKLAIDDVVETMASLHANGAVPNPTTAVDEAQIALLENFECEKSYAKLLQLKRKELIAQEKQLAMIRAKGKKLELELERQKLILIKEEEKKERERQRKAEQDAKEQERLRLKQEADELRKQKEAEEAAQKAAAEKAAADKEAALKAAEKAAAEKLAAEKAAADKAAKEKVAAEKAAAAEKLAAEKAAAKEKAAAEKAAAEKAAKEKAAAEKAARQPVSNLAEDADTSFLLMPNLPPKIKPRARKITPRAPMAKGDEQAKTKDTTQSAEKPAAKKLVTTKPTSVQPDTTKPVQAKSDTDLPSVAKPETKPVAKPEVKTAAEKPVTPTDSIPAQVKTEATATSPTQAKTVEATSSAQAEAAKTAPAAKNGAPKTMAHTPTALTTGWPRRGIKKPSAARVIAPIYQRSSEDNAQPLGEFSPLMPSIPEKVKPRARKITPRAPKAPK